MKKRVILIALVIMCSFLLCMCGQEPEAPTTGDTEPVVTIPEVTESPFVENVKLYWNVDKQKYQPTESYAASSRQPVDGKYTVRFAVEGKQVELTVTSTEMINQIDFQSVMGLEVNDKNEITAVIPVGEGTGGVAVIYSYVQSVSGNTVSCNTVSTSAGVEFKLDVKNVNIYDVSSTGAECGAKTQLKKGDKIYGIKDRHGDLTDLFVVERARLNVDISHTDHCVCGGVGAVSHTCAVEGEWIPWGDDLNEVNTLPKKSGKYFLVQDVKLSVRHEFPQNTEITICLNGKKIGGDNRLFGVYGKLNMCDCKFTVSEGKVTYTGTVEMSYPGASASGGTFYVYDGCVISVYGGNYIATASISNGGIIQTRLGGTFNMYGGYFAGGNVTGKGGIINMMDGGTLNIYGGEITGGTAETVGGGISLVKGTLNISGNPKIHGNSGSNLYISEGLTVNFGKLTEGANIGITLESGVGIVGTAESEEDAAKLVADGAGKKIVWDSTTKQVSIIAE